MTSRGYLAGIGLGVAVALQAAGAHAFHTVFNYRVDRFEADGNALGAYDGVADVVDEFSAAPLDPYFYTAYGTVSEAGGYLQLTNPGVHFPGFPDPSSPSGSLLDLSIAATAYPVRMYDGSGDFSGTAYWEGVIPDVGHHYHFSVYTFGGLPGLFAETFGLAILQRDGGTVEVEQHLTEIDQYSGTFQNTQLLFHEIDPADVTGRLVFRIDFDDATNEATTAFSLDGGTTWQSPFPPGLIFQGRTQAQFLLSADPTAAGTTGTSTTTTTPSSSTTTTTLPGGPCVATGCRLSTLPLKSKLALKNKSSDTADALSWKWKKGAATGLSDFGQPYATTTYWFCLGDGTGANIFEVAIPPGGDCGGTICWGSTGSAHMFTDSSGANGGVRKVILRPGEQGKASIVLKAQGVNLALPAMPMVTPVTARLSNSLGQCWAETFGGAGVLKNTATHFTGKSGSP